jgi:hypothetical protein
MHRFDNPEPTDDVEGHVQPRRLGGTEGEDVEGHVAPEGIKEIGDIEGRPGRS